MVHSNQDIITQARLDLARYVESYAEGIALNAELARVIEEDRYAIGVEIAHYNQSADFESFYDAVMSFDTVVLDAFEATATMVSERYDFENAV